eukprot:6198695-Pleurochrysis_carterae.AAC.1
MISRTLKFCHNRIDLAHLPRVPRHARSDVATRARSVAASAGPAHGAPAAARNGGGRADCATPSRR